MPLDLKRRPKSPYWIIRGTLRGIRIEESTGTGDKRIAEEIRAKREAEILAQSVYGRRATATFAAAALSYLEQGGSKRFTAPVIRQGRAGSGSKEALSRRIAIDSQSAILRHRVSHLTPRSKAGLVPSPDYRETGPSTG
jgi:hypothetical protein